MARINQFLIYVFGYKAFFFSEDCCNLLGGYRKIFFLHNNSIYLIKVWNKWKLRWHFLQADLKLFLPSVASFCNWEISLEIFVSKGLFLPSQTMSFPCAYYQKHSSATEHLGPSQSSAQSTLVRSVNYWRRLAEGGGGTCHLTTVLASMTQFLMATSSKLLCGAAS